MEYEGTVACSLPKGSSMFEAACSSLIGPWLLLFDTTWLAMFHVLLLLLAFLLVASLSRCWLLLFDLALSCVIPLTSACVCICPCACSQVFSLRSVMCANTKCSVSYLVLPANYAQLSKSHIYSPNIFLYFALALDKIVLLWAILICTAPSVHSEPRHVG